MNRTIIAICGRANEGKSDTIKRVCKTLLRDFPNASPAIHEINYDWDILLTIQLGSIKIGIESQGDPNSRMLNQNTIEDLAKQNCDIIICATRTEGKTVNKVDEIADKYDYHIIWLSSFFSPSLNSNVLNQKAANNIINLIKSLIVGQL